MLQPKTPLVGCDVFVVNRNLEVLLIQRKDNGLWALPGGFHDLGETAQMCAERECLEETGLKVMCTQLFGVYSSNCYEYRTYQNRENEICHLLFLATILGGEEIASEESLRIGWYSENCLPKLSDGHEMRILHGFNWIKGDERTVYFE